MRKMDNTREIIRKLNPKTSNIFRHGQSLKIDEASGMLIYRWIESRAGADPYNEYEEFYRLDLPFADVYRLVENARNSGKESKQNIHCKIGQSYIHYDDYSGSEGGSGKIAWSTPPEDSPNVMGASAELRYVPETFMLNIEITYK
jgi:hypothetical protein